MTASRFPDAPPQIAALKVDERGYPIPWFVPWFDGKPEFRAVDPRQAAYAARHNLCWVCGRPFQGALRSFTIGPMCAVNRVSPEPPEHLDCAIFAVRACPFLSRPMAKRRNTADLERRPPPGLMIERNPGVTLVWVTRSYRTEKQPEGGQLYRIGPPVSVGWWSEGRNATRAEVLESIRSGLPLLRNRAELDGPAALAQLDRMTERALKLVPAE